MFIQWDFPRKIPLCHQNATIYNTLALRVSQNSSDTPAGCPELKRDAHFFPTMLRVLGFRTPENPIYESSRFSHTRKSKFLRILQFRTSRVPFFGRNCHLGQKVGSVSEHFPDLKPKIAGAPPFFTKMTLFATLWRFGCPRTQAIRSLGVQNSSDTLPFFPKC